LREMITRLEITCDLANVLIQILPLYLQKNNLKHFMPLIICSGP
jgi:hypothetical protein